MPPHALFSLPLDVGHQLVALLEHDDLEALQDVNSDARHSTVIGAMYAVYPMALVLPPTDLETVKRLVDGQRKTTTPLSLFQWIQITTPETVDILLAPSVRGRVESVRLEPLQPEQGGTAARVSTICDKLRGLPHLYKLSLAHTKFHDVAPLASMTQLRELDLRHTNVQNVAHLAALVNLQVLLLEVRNFQRNPTSSGPDCVCCVENMTELRVLRVWMSYYRDTPTCLPPLHKLTKLHTLELQSCSIGSVGDLRGAAKSLCHLDLHRVVPRNKELPSDERDAEELLVVKELTRLESITIYCSDKIIESSVDSLARIPSLRTIGHWVQGDICGLVHLPRLESLKLGRGIEQRKPEDLAVLQQLPNLTTLTVEPSDPLRNTTMVADALAPLRSLKHLQIESFNVKNAALARLAHMESLNMQWCEFKSMGWILSFQSLRSLRLSVGTGACDLSAIAQLTQLEELEYYDRERDMETLSDYSFFAPLVNLKSVELVGIHFHNIGCVRDMAKLRKLTVQSRAHDVVTANTHALCGLYNLRELDVSKSDITDMQLLRGLPQLRCVAISHATDCAPLVTQGRHPRLLRILHPTHNCLWKCALRGDAGRGLRARAVIGSSGQSYIP